jgi:hypothetical protein
LYKNGEHGLHCLLDSFPIPICLPLK